MLCCIVHCLYYQFFSHHYSTGQENNFGHHKIIAEKEINTKKESHKINAKKESHKITDEKERGMIGIGHQTHHIINSQTSEHCYIGTNMNGQVSVYTKKLHTHIGASINSEYDNVIRVQSLLPSITMV